jgi:hypothetical protein
MYVCSMLPTRDQIYGERCSKKALEKCQGSAFYRGLPVFDRKVSADKGVLTYHAISPAPVETYYRRPRRLMWKQLAIASWLSVGGDEGGRCRRHHVARARRDRSWKSRARGIILHLATITLPPLVRNGTTHQKKDSEDTRIRSQPMRSHSTVTRRARTVAFYSVQRCGSPRNATGHL